MPNKSPAPSVPLERDVQRAVRAAYEACGCFVANFAQGYRPGGRRHATTRQTKGIPDLYVFPPLRSAFTIRAGFGVSAVQPFFHEVKRPSGKQTPEQAAWQRMCEVRGVAYVLGGVEEALAYLRLLGLVRA